MYSGTSDSDQIAASMCPNGFSNSPRVPTTPMNRAPSRIVSRAVIEIARAASLVRLTLDLTPSIPGF